MNIRKLFVAKLNFWYKS